VKVDSISKAELNAAAETERAVRRREANFPARKARKAGSDVGRWWILYM
jgi:hypothetical protein